MIENLDNMNALKHLYLCFGNDHIFDLTREKNYDQLFILIDMKLNRSKKFKRIYRLIIFNLLFAFNQNRCIQLIHSRNKSRISIL